MNSLELFFLTLFTAGVTIISYKGYALQKGWAIGQMYHSDSSILKIVGLLSIGSSFIISFFYIKWYFVLLGALIGWLISGAITAIFRVNTQWIALFLLIASFIILIIN